MLLNQFLFSSDSLASLRSPSALFSFLSAGAAACGGKSGRQDLGMET